MFGIPAKNGEQVAVRDDREGDGAWILARVIKYVPESHLYEVGGWMRSYQGVGRDRNKSRNVSCLARFFGLSWPVLPCHVMSCPVMSCPVMSWPGLACDVMFLLFRTYPFGYSGVSRITSCFCCVVFRGG